MQIILDPRHERKVAQRVSLVLMRIDHHGFGTPGLQSVYEGLFRLWERLAFPSGGGAKLGSAPAHGAWPLTMCGKQGIGNPHGGEDGSGVVDAHDMCAAQNGGDHHAGVTRQEERVALFAHVAATR